MWTGAMVFDSTDASKGIVRTSRFDGGASAVEDVIADGDSFYSRPNESALQKEAEWLGFGYAVGEEMDEVDFVGADVGPELEALGEATDVVAAGTAKVRGVETTRYRGNAPGLGHVEVWIDGDDRVRRLRVAGSKVEEGGREAMTNMSVDFFDFGAVPEIKPPARDQVLNVREFEIANLERQGE
ncbi:MAG TPA: hypothetical protein VJ204_17055 [Solirubrobacterales bacterium]|nr:hypothetical protein [Solirubrobacterales bacterium]